MKKVNWDAPKTTSAVRAPGSYSSYAEFAQKQSSIQEEQREAQALLQKAYPIMSALLEYKLTHQEPLIVMRPFRYATSELPSAIEDDGFYKSQPRATEKFVDVIKVINPGTQIVLKSIQPSMQQYIFVDGMGNEHEIGFQEKNNLMSQTSVFEETRQYLESKGI